MIGVAMQNLFSYGVIKIIVIPWTEGILEDHDFKKALHRFQHRPDQLDHRSELHKDRGISFFRALYMFIWPKTIVSLEKKA